MDLGVKRSCYVFKIPPTVIRLFCCFLCFVRSIYKGLDLLHFEANFSDCILFFINKLISIYKQFPNIWKVQMT